MPAAIALWRYLFASRSSQTSHLAEEGMAAPYQGRKARLAAQRARVDAKVGLVTKGFLVVKVACLQQHSRSPGCRAMKSIAFALLLGGYAVFVSPCMVHALDTPSLLPPVKLVPQSLSTGPVPQVSPGDEKQPTPQSRQESPTDGMPTGPQSPEVDHASSPPTGASSEQAPPVVPVPPQPGTGFPWWPVICAVLVVMLVYQMKRRA